MRLSSLLATIALVVGFLSVLTPACYDAENEMALSWIELHESPVLWIYMASLGIISAQDIEVLEGIPFLRKSNIKLLRIILLIIGFLMAFSLELSVNVFLSNGSSYWNQNLFFRMPSHPNVQEYTSVAYHLIRMCRLIIGASVILDVFDQNTPKQQRKLALKARSLYQEKKEKR